MAEILFVFENKKEVIKCDTNEKMNDIFKRIAMNIDKDINLLIFIYNGIILNPSESRIFLQIANDLDKKRKKMQLLIKKILN